MNVTLIGATWPETVSGRHWAAMPDAFRTAGLVGALEARGFGVAEVILQGAPTIHGAFKLAGEIGRAVKGAVAEGIQPVIVCGSCTVAAVGGVAGLGGGASILWMDAHPDLNTPETTRSGLFEGMALAAAIGLCWRTLASEAAGLDPVEAKRAVLFGARDIDPPEAEAIRRLGIARADSLSEIRLTPAEGPLYVHLDMDVHDSLAVRANAFAVPHGPGIEDIRAAIVAVAARRPVTLAVTGLEPQGADGRRAVDVGIDHIIRFAEATGRAA